MKVNLHILESCNFRCKYCFAHFNSFFILSLDSWKSIVDNISKCEDIDAINIAGGEPFLYKDLGSLVEYIFSKGLKLSIITNGSLMTEDWIKNYAKYFYMIGFSIDTLKDGVSAKIGRLSCDIDFTNFIRCIRRVNPDCQIKVNTVVNHYNKDDILSDWIEANEINRWKLLRISYFRNDKFDNTNILISETEFRDYIKRNQINNQNVDIVIENDLRASYIMVDARGYLVSGYDTDNYEDVGNLLTDDFSSCLSKLYLNQDLYDSRYK